MTHPCPWLDRWAPYAWMIGHRALRGGLAIRPDPPGSGVLSSIHHRILWIRRGRVVLDLGRGLLEAGPGTVLYLAPDSIGSLTARPTAWCLTTAFDLLWRKRAPARRRRGPMLLVPGEFHSDERFEAWGMTVPAVLDQSRTQAATVALTAMYDQDWSSTAAPIRVQLHLTAMLSRWFESPTPEAPVRRTVAELAAAAGVSTRTLYRQLQAEGRPTPARHLGEGLDQRAIQLLQFGLPVAEVASRLGYTASGFIRAFRRWHGLPPHAWRRAGGPGTADRSASPSGPSAAPESPSAERG